MHKTKRNISTMLISQLVATACGVVIPRVFISTFGSAVYGLTSSIAQFLSYITMLEAGIGRVARAEMYGPLARKDYVEVSRVYHAIKRFFSIIGIVFIGYTLVLSVSYYDIADVQDYSRINTFLLVWIISAGTLAKYMGGLSCLTLINADQRQYVGNLIITASTIINAVSVVLLAKLGCDMVIIKLGSSIIYVAQPICYWIYVRKHYQLPPVGKNVSKLKQKWTGLGQHIAYFLHDNTDIVILTLFADLKLVAVYSVYRLVITSVRKIASSFTSGMEAAFGELIAKDETSVLQRVFIKNKYMMSFTSVLLFGTTAVLVVPFVRLYTQGVTDANYIQPAFAVILLFAEAIDCFMHPCASIAVSANKLKETRWGSYGEAIINIVLSFILIWWNPLLGVALATLIATVFKGLFYMIYAAKNILHISVVEPMKFFVLTNGLILLFALFGFIVLHNCTISNYIQWIIWGCGTFGTICIVTTLAFFAIYPDEQKNMLQAIVKKCKGK